jgi:hypothetical protein
LNSSGFFAAVEAHWRRNLRVSGANIQQLRGCVSKFLLNVAMSGALRRGLGWRGNISRLIQKRGVDPKVNAS